MQFDSRMGRAHLLAALVFLTLSLRASAQPTVCDRPVGPDVIVGELYDVNNFSAQGSVEAFSVGTISCNVGNANLSWVANTNQHPVIGQNLFRLKTVNGAARFEHVGQSWLKHGFTALTNDDCNCGCNGVGGSALGVGCSDPYSASLNASQSGLGPKFEVNADTGFYPYPFTGSGQTGNSIYKRLQVQIPDLDPALQGGGLYFVEGQYVTPDDAANGNQNNNASYRQVTFSGSGSAWSIFLAGSTQREQAGIRAWKDQDSTVTETNVQIPTDGLIIVSSKATSLGGGIYHYEFAAQNLNSDRCIGSFSVPIPSGASVTNVGFHDVFYHSGEPFDGTDWPGIVSGSAVTWSTTPHATNPNANALRWGTLYNFRFDINATPAAINATLGLFKPGTPSSVTAAIQGPGTISGTVDCNSNGINDITDIANGTSQDCNGTNVPDECESFPAVTLASQLIAGGFTSPIYAAAPPGDVGRLFIVEQGGRIMIRDLVGNTTLATPFLDISGIITIGGERGLLGLAFHPSYATNGFFFVYYTNSSGNSVIARYTANAPFPTSNTANPASAVILKTITQPAGETNHKAGCIQFGKDGMLYVAVGDGGGANDQHGANGNGQNTGTLLGKMLRLDPNNAPTYIPANNPFVGGGNPLDEIWAVGMRNPWRFSFDRLTGALYIGDVGQDAREEIDYEPPGFAGGRNYGWRCMEGTACTGLSGCTCNAANLTLPILEYLHSSLPSAPCVSLTGGYAYRGCAMPSVSGRYFYADYCADFVRSFRYVGGAVTDPQDHTSALGNIAAPVSFGEGGDGELYVVSYLGNIYKIIPYQAPVCGNGIVEPGEQCDDNNGNPGDGCFNCQIEAGGDNNACANATVICSGMFTGNNATATNDGSASCGSSSSSPDRWYKFTPTASGTLSVSTCGSNDLGGVDAGMDTVLSIHSGCPGTSGNQLVCNDDWGTGGQPANACSATDAGTEHYDSAVSISATAGASYYIRVSGYNGSAGNFILNVSGPACSSIIDCNANGRADAQDIACGGGNTCNGLAGSWDCNSNAVPDECEVTPVVNNYPVSVNPPLSIPDNNPAFVSHNFTVPDSGNIQDLNVFVTINHTYNGDLIVRLVHNATTVVLIDRPGYTGTGFGFSDNGFNNVQLDDEGTQPIETWNPAGEVTITSPPNFIPNQALSAFDGQNRQGVWSLQISDNASADTGALTGWALQFTAPGTVTPCPPLVDCNGNGIQDATDISSGTSADCNVNTIPDECDIATSPGLDCNGGPVGIASAGQAIFSTTCFGCHNTNGQGGSGGGCGGVCPGPNIRNFGRDQIWDMLLPPTDHPGGAHPEYTQQDFANLEAFLADGGSRGRPDMILDSCQPIGADCDSDGTSDACELEAGSQVDINYDGLPDTCQAPANDACADALPISNGSTPFSTVNATTDGPVESGACVKFGDPQVHRDIWYVYTAPCSGELSLSTCNAANFDTKIAVYAGTTCPTSGSAIACRDDTDGCGTTTQLTVPVVSGNAYLIRLGGYNNATGTGTLTLGCTATGMPMASFTAMPNPAACNQQVTFNASASSHSNPNRMIVAWDWDLDNDGQYDDASGQIVQWTFAQYGSHPVSLRVTDDDVPAQTDTESQVIDVNQGNAPPIADAGGPYQVSVGGNATFNGTGSSDPNAACGDSIVDYAWDFDNDGQYDDAQTASPSLTWAQMQTLGIATLGSHPIGLRVVDEFSATGTDAGVLSVVCGIPPGGDVNGDGSANGKDIATFVTALLSGSTNPAVVCPADFTGNGAIDTSDIPGMVAALLGA